MSCLWGVGPNVLDSPPERGIHNLANDCRVLLKYSTRNKPRYIARSWFCQLRNTRVSFSVCWPSGVTNQHLDLLTLTKDEIQPHPNTSPRAKLVVHCSIATHLCTWWKETKCKTNTLPILMHQMHNSTNHVSQVEKVGNPKKKWNLKEPSDEIQTEYNEIEPNPSKDRAMPEGENLSSWNEFTKFPFFLTVQFIVVL
jgi:hypothetical protein